MAEDRAPENVKRSMVISGSTWFARHLGLPVGLVSAVVLLGWQWLESKNEDFNEAQKNLIELNGRLDNQAKDIEFLKTSRETNKAQWRAIQRIHEKADRIEVTATANEIILDKFLDDRLLNKGNDKKPNVTGQRPGKLPIIVRRIPPKNPKTVKQYTDEQMQLQMQRQEK